MMDLEYGQSTRPCAIIEGVNMRNPVQRSVVGFLATVMAGTAWGSAAAKEGDILLRLRAIGIVPIDSSEGIQPDLVTTGLSPGNAVVPELDVTYMVLDNFGVELIAATSHHDIKATGALSNLGNVGEAWLLPPTLLAQYHFIPDGPVRPYVGAGLNVTFTYGEQAQGSLKTALGQSTKLELGNSVGWAAQAGVDIQLTDDIFLNLDVKYIDIDIDAKITTGAVTRTDTVHIDPVIIGIGIGMRF